MLYRMATQQPVGQSNSLSDVKGVNRFLLGWESQITTLKLDNIKPLGCSNVPLYRCAFYDIGLLCMYSRLHQCNGKPQSQWVCVQVTESPIPFSSFAQSKYFFIFVYVCLLLLPDKKYSCVKTTNNLILKIETDSCHNYRPVPY